MQALLTNPRFSMCFDGMHGVAGPCAPVPCPAASSEPALSRLTAVRRSYARSILVDELGLLPQSLVRCSRQRAHRPALATWMFPHNGHHVSPARTGGDG
jgi:hypothetical protein